MTTTRRLLVRVGMNPTRRPCAKSRDWRPAHFRVEENARTLKGLTPLL
jgi:hypothetical protein